MDSKYVVLIVSPPGDLQIGLQALLTTHLDIDILVVGEAISALKIIERNNPVAVILDQNIFGDSIAQIVNDIKANWSQVMCIALVNDDQSRQDLSGVGVDLILIKGLPGVKFVAHIKKLLRIEE